MILTCAAIWVPADQKATVLTTIGGFATLSIPQLLTYLKSQSNNQELKAQNQTLEAIHTEASKAKVEAVATRREAGQAKEEIIEAVKSTQGQPGEL